MNVPKGLSEVTADWLESVLQPSEKFNGVEIESVSCDNIGAVSYTHLTLPTNREV